MLVHRYADGTVDGELALVIKRGESTQAAMTRLRDAFETHALGLGTATWISVGERFVIKEDEQVYRRHKGMNEIRTHYTRASRSTVAPTFGTARDIMSPGAEKKYKRKAETIFVRLHWNPENAKPRR